MTVYICTPGLKAIKIEAHDEQAAAVEYFRRSPLTNGMICTLFVYDQAQARRLECDGRIVRMSDLDALVRNKKCVFFSVRKCIAMSGLPADSTDYANGAG